MNAKGLGRPSWIAAAIGLALGSVGAYAQIDDGARQIDPERSHDQVQTGEQDHTIVDSSVRTDEQTQDEGQTDLDRLTDQNRDLSTFVDAVEAAGLTNSLVGGTQYTAFAPTNEAFEQENVDELLQPENREELIALLRAHIVADDVDEEMTRTLHAVRTIDGGTVEIAMEDDKLMVGDAGATGPDIEIGNLRVYAVDAVLEKSESQATAALESQEDSESQRDQTVRSQ